MNSDFISDEQSDPFQTDEDSDYVPDEEEQRRNDSVTHDDIENENSDSDHEIAHVTPAKTRKRKRRVEEWKDKVAKRLRTEGKEYVGRKNKPQRARELQEYTHMCRYHCNQNISENQRRQLHEKFYALPSYDLQTSFLSSCIKKGVPARRNVCSTTQKIYSTVITLLGKRVCKKFFLKTFDITVRRFKVVCDKTSELRISEPDKRGKHEPPNKMAEATKNGIIQHIKKFPRYSSHYSRQDNPNTRYLSGDLNIRKMYLLYKEFCEAKSETPAKESYYRHVFNTEFNLKFHRPYTDTCSYCDNLQNLIKKSENLETVAKSKRELELHQRKAQKATESKKADVEANKNSEDTAVICFDLQQTLPTPLLTTSKVFYLRQLWTYNFCVYDLLSGKSHMFVWDETIAARGSQEIGSCLIKFIKSLPPNITKIIAYSDSCGGQNKNKNITKLFAFLVQATHLTEIHHKFLEPGHTYMECDRSFGLIEKKKRQIPQVFVPSDWQQVIQNSSSKFSVCNMTLEDFYSFSQLHVIMKDPKKDTDGHVLKWREIRRFAYWKGEKLSFGFKTTLDNEMEFSMCSIAKPQVGRPSFQLSSLKPLNNTTLKIKIDKYRNLLSLLTFIPPIHHNFYKNLQHYGISSRTGKSEPSAEVANGNDGTDDDEDNVMLQSDYE